MTAKVVPNRVTANWGMDKY